MVNTPIKNGLIMGAVLCIGAIAMAMISPRAYVLYGRLALLLAALFFMYKIGKDEKELNEGVLSFGEAFKAIFIGSIIAYAMLNVFEFVLFNYIKPELNIITHEVALEMTNKTMDMLSGVLDTDMEAMDRAKVDIANDLTVERLSRTVGNALLTFFGNLIFPCVTGGLLMSLFTKSKNA